MMINYRGNPDILEIGTASVPRGQRTHATFFGGYGVDGMPLQVPLVVVNGRRSGPVLWVQAGTHGDEYDGMIALQRIVNLLDPDQLRGALIAVLALNISAFQNRQRTSPIDSLDINRIYPGDPNGTYTRRLAHRVLELVNEHADCFIDLHGGGNEFGVVYYSLYRDTGDEVGEVSGTLAKAAGSPLIWASRDEWLAGGLFTHTTESGIPSVIIECGGEGRLHDSNINAHFTSILNIMRRLDMLPDPPDAPDHFVIMDGADFFTTSQAGFVHPLIHLGDRVGLEQPLMRIVNVYGEDVETVLSPYEDAVVLAVKTYGATPGGTLAGILGRVAREEVTD